MKEMLYLMSDETEKEICGKIATMTLSRQALRWYKNEERGAVKTDRTYWWFHPAASQKDKGRFQL